jgi:hypothetical protein
VPLVITGSEVPGVIPLEVTDDLLDELRRLTDHHEPGLMVEQGVELLAMLDWSRASLDNVSVRAKRGGLTSIFQEESDKVIKRHPTPLLTCDDA